MRTIDNEDDAANIAFMDNLVGSIVVAIITCIIMYNEGDHIICNETNCFLHRYSFWSYVLWIPANIAIFGLIHSIYITLVGFPIFYNLFFLDRFCYPEIYRNAKKEKEKELENLYKKFNDYHNKRGS